jgi:hypothetical protein
MNQTKFPLLLHKVHKSTSKNSNERANRNLEFCAAVLQSCSAAVKNPRIGVIYKIEFFPLNQLL